jgi:hypothetical protein
MCSGDWKGSGMREVSPETWDAIARQGRRRGPGRHHRSAFHRFSREDPASRARIPRRANPLGGIRDGAEDGDVVAAVQTQEAQPTAVAERADARTLLLKRHRAAWDDIHALGSEAMRILRREEPQILKGLVITDAEERLCGAERLLTLFSQDAGAPMLAQEGERRADGLDYKQLQEAQTEDEATASRRQELIASILSSTETMKRRANAADAREEMSESG